MKMSKLSNQTNSQDPQAVNSRVFVGNLNTFQCSKTDVERMFQKYGRLAGISMHKGYAFVQFTNPFDARNACHGEDGKTILSQTLDVNMVAEPKAHQIGRKRQNVTKTGNDWDYFYDSYYSSTLFRSSRPIKRKRLMANQQQSRILADSVKQNQINAAVAAAALASHQHQSVALNGISNIQTHHTQLYSQQPNTNGISACNGSPSHNPMTQYIHPAFSAYNCNVENNTSCAALQWGPFKIYSNPDTLICGNCRECFTELSELLDHKKVYCKLRFTCKCQDSSSEPTKNSMPSAKLLCAVCKEMFTNPWDLMVHAQSAHTFNIYELGSEINSNNKVDNGLPNASNVFCKNDEGNSSDGDNFCVNENSLKDDVNVIDDLSVDERLSQSSNSHIITDELSKLNGSGSLSSRGSSPVSGNEEARECILHALSIQNTRNMHSPTTSSPIDLMSTSLFHAPEPITLQ